MSLADYFNIRRQVTGNAESVPSLVDEVVQYLVAHSAQDEFFPAIVAASLHRSELLMLVAFGELDDRGVVMPIYITYCRDHAHPLGEYPSREAVPEEEHCEIGDHEVALANETMYFEVAFRVNRTALNAFQKAAA
jgi:hypothetical protein